jgi:hypothetical protein
MNAERWGLNQQSLRFTDYSNQDILSGISTELNKEGQN